MSQQGLSLLRELRLHGTRVTGDVASLKSLGKLTELRLHDTMVQGELWRGVGDLRDLTVSDRELKTKGGGWVKKGANWEALALCGQNGWAVM